MLYIPNLFKTIPVEAVKIPAWIHTNADLIDYANGLLRPRPSRSIEIYMLCDIVQSIITFCCCAYVMLKKGRMKDARFVTLCRSPFGTYIVPNVIWTLLSLFGVYLVTWGMGFCSWIIYVQWTDRPLVEWLWYIPLPWLPLMLAAFYATYGFVITCSPRSPISNLGGTRRKGVLTSRLSLIHLPLPHSAWVMNTFVLGVGIIMVVYNLVITSLNGKARAWTHRAQNDVYHQLLLKPHTQEWLDAVPSDETLLLVRWGVCGLQNVYRWCCAALASYVVLIAVTTLMLVLYSIPNHIFLLDHLCRIFPDKDLEQPARRTLWTNMRTLWKIGSPRNLHGPSYSAFKKTWMMTMIGHSCVFAILGGVLLFSVAPVYLIFVPWNGIYHGRSSTNQVKFILAYVITAAFILAAFVTGISATLTFDDIFNTVSGLGNAKGSKTGRAGSGGGGLSVYADPSSTASTGVPSPQSPIGSPRSATFPGSPRSPTFLTSPTHLRPMPSFSPSSAGSHGEKSFSEEMAGDEQHSTNQVLVVTRTTVHVDHCPDHDLEAVDPAFHSSADMHPAPLPVTPPAAGKPYSFLSRKNS